jgi:hypothetical protein
MKKLLGLFVSSMVLAQLAGCAGFTQVVAAKEKSDKIAVEAANDNIVEGLKDATCALPYGTLLRHPEMQVAAQSICGATADPGALLPAARMGAIAGGAAAGSGSK